MAYWIKAEVQTYIKDKPEPANKLNNDQKQLVEEGTSFKVDEYSRIAGGQYRLIIEGKEKFIFDNAVHGKWSHWRCSWEDDTKETDILVAPPVSHGKKTKFVGANLRPSDSFSTMITPNISYGEFALYDERRRFDYKHQCETAYRIALFLEECRSEFNDNPVIITSGYRPPAINRQVGGASLSEHLYRAPDTGAVDFRIANANIYEVEQYCDKRWGYSLGYGAKKGFVHIGIRANKRNIKWNY